MVITFCVNFLVIKVTPIPFLSRRNKSKDESWMMHQLCEELFCCGSPTIIDHRSASRNLNDIIDQLAKTLTDMWGEKEGGGSRGTSLGWRAVLAMRGGESG